MLPDLCGFYFTSGFFVCVVIALTTWWFMIRSGKYLVIAELANIYISEGIFFIDD